MEHTIAYLKRQLNYRMGAPNPNTIYRLGKLAHPDATTLLLDLLHVPDVTEDSMQYILAALRYTNDPRARRTLLHYFHHDFETSTVVINSLGILREKDAVPLMLALLKGDKSTTLDYHSAMSLRFRLVIALGNIGDLRALPALNECLKDTKTVLKFALADVQLQVPLCEYAHDALIKIGTPQAIQIANEWKIRYDDLLAREAQALCDEVQAVDNFIDLQGDLIRLKHHALLVLRSMNILHKVDYPNIAYNVIKEFAKQKDRLCDEANQAIQDFIIDELNTRYNHLSLEQSFMLLDYYDDPRAIDIALETFANPDFHPDVHGDPLGFLTRKRVQSVVPIIAERIDTEGISERYLASLGMIGGNQAEAIVSQYLQSEHEAIRMSAIYALADLARESDSALETISQLIDSADYSVAQQAIIRLDKVGSRAIFILLSLLRNYDKWSASRALSTLARIKDVRVIPYLLERMTDPTCAHIHREIVNTLEKLEDETAYEIVNLWQLQHI